MSFAGAQRDYVEQVAAALQGRGVRCFYDADEQIDLWGKYLAEELPAVYCERAATVVVFVSADYAERDWTRLERRAALNRAAQERREYVLPARFDDTPLPGLLSDMVAVDLRTRSPQEFAVMVAAKLSELGITVLAPTGEVIIEQPGPLHAPPRNGARAASCETLNRWIVLGGGRLGLGFLTPIARGLDLRPLIFAAGEKTPRDIAERFNNASEKGDGYWIECDDPFEQLQVIDYSFQLSINTGLLIDAIADPDTVVLSTSVGLDRLLQLAPIVALGLERRASIDSARDVSRLLILVCENGRSPEDLTAPEWFRRTLENLVGRERLSELIEVPRVVIDAIVPVRGRPGVVTQVSRGTMWIEDTGLVQKLMSGSQSVRIVSGDEIALIHTRKLYCFNALHLLLSVFGYFTRESTVDRVATDPTLQTALNRIVDALVTAACQRHGLRGDDVAASESTREYGRRALKRLQRPPRGNFDPVSRALDGLVTGRYVRDGRIDGPLADAGLIAEPDQARELVHAMSLSLYYIVSSIDRIRHRFLWLPRDSVHQDADRPYVELAHVPVFARTSCFGEDRADSQLMEVMARDFAELDQSLTRGHWSASDLARYLDRPIRKNIPVLPRRLDRPRLVVFSLSEGLVATESLLYEVTRDLIREYSDLHPAVSLDFYASHVGMSEIRFFTKMARLYQIRGKSPAELVSEREKRYRSRLQTADPDSLLKPRFRDILELLAGRDVKMAVCSNASRARMLETLERVGIAEYFKGCVTPDDGMAPKPSPDMLISLQREFDAQPRDCLVVESSLTGAKASIAAGCYTILLVNDYTAPGLVPRRGVEVLPNSQALANWFDALLKANDGSC